MNFGAGPEAGPKDRVKITEWQKNEAAYCNKLWPGWNSHLLAKHGDITTVTQLWKKTFASLTDDLVAEMGRDKEDKTGMGGQDKRQAEEVKGWVRWMEKWSKYSVLQCLQEPSADGLRPWPKQVHLWVGIRITSNRYI